MPEQAPFDLTGAPRPWFGRYWLNRLGTWLYRRRRPVSREDVVRLLTPRRPD